MTLKKVIAAGMTAVMAMSVLTGCSKKDDSKDQKKIGVVQLVEHDALDAAYKGFKEGLEEAGYKDGDKIKIEYKNAQNEQSNCQTIAEQFANDKCDLVLAIATPAAQAMANETKDIPILVTAVTDPKDAKLVKSNEKPGTNVSGTSDLTPVKEQMGLLKELVPGAKKVAMLYCSAEANSKFQVEIAKKEAKKLDLQSVDATVSESSEIRQVVESLKGKVDAIYSPTDNMIAAGINTVSMVANEAKIPFIVGEEGMCVGGGLATYGVNYYELGKQTAAQAVKILEGKAEPKDMPIEYQENADLIINKDTVKKLGIKIPEKLQKKAKMVTTQKNTDKE
ncbi:MULTISPECIES: ABC transporter substrate-binding protein [Anaerostipes]|uniref:ABC transporter substrate-binding protein n=1 Tax=Anaerostipes TaxID=207244 RepID=UPI000951D905|nr:MULTISPECIES: ABC transporter substrate-binding protein [Anaerostipes]MCI5622182.1 ABC transporter substrate-binding protein [Anaerostipes sp.]MDY2725926.1 ABC transporter substrate-binding protein [Anaerostipes faecalis]OLR58746.1 sugar ABC transporter substrate-binding protein [Anaerostipes sp. 494a]